MTDLISHFDKIRSEQGEEAYQKARKNFAMGMILKPQGDEFIKQAFPDMGIEAIRADAEKSQPSMGSDQAIDPQEMMLTAMRQQIPNLKTQAQFNLFMKSFDALRHTLNSAFGLDKEGYEKGKEALNMALDMALKISEVVQKLQETPEAATSKAAEEFKQPPREFQEYDVQKGLLIELETLTSAEELQRWYDNNRARIDCVVSASLRNELFDTIRKIKHKFTPPS
jgi:hypothetical protein